MCGCARTRACFRIHVRIFFFLFFFFFPWPEGARVIKRRQESWLHLVTFSHFFPAPSHQTPPLLCSPLFPSHTTPAWSCRCITSHPQRHVSPTVMFLKEALCMNYCSFLACRPAAGALAVVWVACEPRMVHCAAVRSER